MTRRSLLRLVPLVPFVLLGCKDALSPLYRPGPPPKLGDFFIQVDSVIVTPNPVRRGDSVTVVLRGGQAADCTRWVLVRRYQTVVEARLEPWGIRGNGPPCSALQDGEMRVRAPENGEVDSFTLTVLQPGGRDLHVRVALTGPDPRFTGPPARPKRPPARDSARAGK